MAGDLLAALAAPLNRRILAVLAVEPTYARRIAALLGSAEAEVSRRLRALERHGILASQWQRETNNVKVYRLRTTSLRLDVTPAGVEVVQRPGPRKPPAAATSPLPPVQGFVGRQAALQVLEAGDPVVIVEGLPGMGKSSLLARHVQGGPALWITCRGSETLRWVAMQTASHRAAHGDIAPLQRLHQDMPGPQVAALLLEMVQREDAVTVLDDVHRISDPGLLRWVADAVATTRTGRLLLASRERIPYAPRPGVRRLELGGLDDRDAVALLGAAGIDVSERLVPRLRDEVGGHPMALHLLAEAARSDGLERLLDRRPERELTHYLLEEIDAQLTANERTALSHASIFPHAFEAQDLEALGTRNAEGVLHALRRRRLVAGAEKGYLLPEVVRNFFYERLQDLPRLHRAAAGRCIARGDVASHLEALHHLLAAGDRHEVVGLLSQDLDIHDHHALDEGHRRLYENILDTFRPEDVDAATWAQILDERGDIAYHDGRLDDALAHYEQAARHFLEHEAQRYAEVAWKMALCLRQKGMIDAALASCQDAQRHATGGLLERLRALEAEMGALVRT